VLGYISSKVDTESTRCLVFLNDFALVVESYLRSYFLDSYFIRHGSFVSLCFPAPLGLGSELRSLLGLDSK
jgi:hypothetical protein